MIFTGLHITDFMSFEDVELPLEGQGLVMVCGENLDNSLLNSNGAGKSAIFEALVWGLFGKTCRGHKDVVRDGQRECIVTVYFRSEAGEEYTLTRSTGKGGSSLYFWVGDRDDKMGGSASLKESTIRDTQAKVERLLGCDFNTFTNAIMLSQEHLVPFASATDKSQKAILEAILGIDIYEIAQRLARERKKSAETSADALRREVTRLGLRREELEEDIEALEEQRLSAEEERREKEEERKAKRLRQLRAKKGFEKRLEDARFEVAEKEEALGELAQGVSADELDDTISKLSSEQATAHSKLQTIADELDEIGEEVNRIETLQGGKCPTCFQDVPASAVEPVLDEYGRKAEELQAEDKRWHAEWSGLKDSHAVNKQLREGCRQIQKEITALNEQIRELASDVSTCDKVVEALSEPVEVDAVSGIEKMVAEKRQEVEKAAREAQRVGAEAKEFDRTADLLGFWEIGFGKAGLVSLILDSVTKRLNQWANEYLEKMMEGVTVEFNTIVQLASGEFRDKFSVTVKHASGRDEYLSNSGGERRRIDFAIMLALRRLAASRAEIPFNVVFYDEVFEKLDDAGIDTVMGILEEESTRCDSIFVISHDDALKDAFPRVWRVRKAEGVSTLEV